MDQVNVRKGFNLKGIGAAVPELGFPVFGNHPKFLFSTLEQTGVAGAVSYGQRTSGRREVIMARTKSAPGSDKSCKSEWISPESCSFKPRDLMARALHH
jgi:hypothetical protein